LNSKADSKNQKKYPRDKTLKKKQQKNGNLGSGGKM